MYSYKLASTASFKSNFQELFLIILITPIADLLKAKGSVEPVGISPIAKSPAIVSILSASEKIEPTLDSGRVSPANLGRYCSLIAVATISFSPDFRA